MSTKQKRFILPEDEIPKYWYNIQADMKTKPMPPLNPKTKEALKPEDLYPIFAKELCKQELNQTDAWIEIPEAVCEMYKYYRSTPLVRAYGLEKALGTPAHIYFKNESVSPIGSHKLNSALAQAYYCKEEGITDGHGRAHHEAPFVHIKFRRMVIGPASKVRILNACKGKDPWIELLEKGEAFGRHPRRRVNDSVFSKIPHKSLSSQRRAGFIIAHLIKGLGHVGDFIGTLIKGRKMIQGLF